MGARAGNQNARSHGDARHGQVASEYFAWQSMIRRCTAPKDARYVRYGARGIGVSSRWLGVDGYANFLEDMGRRPSAKHSLERKNNDGNYEPDNCRWATKSEQQRNQRRSVLFVFEGHRASIHYWAAEFDIPMKTIYGRLARGWSVEKALTTRSH